MGGYSYVDILVQNFLGAFGAENVIFERFTETIFFPAKIVFDFQPHRCPRHTERWFLRIQEAPSVIRKIIFYVAAVPKQ